VYDLNTNTIYSGRWLQRPKITIKVYEGDHTAWEIFRKHHYLSGTLLGNSKCFLFFWKNLLVGFVATSTLPSGTVKKAYREHRLVVLPDYQGLGIGSTISEYTAKIMLSKGKRYFSRTSHYKMGEYRNKSDVWRPTSSNMTSAVAEQGTMKNWTSSDGRMCYSHEYIGK
jgi:GNAT superfamily N-acetyltransferase